MLTELTNTNDPSSHNPPRQEESFVEENIAPEKEGKSNPFTHYNATRLIDLDQTEFTIPDTFTSIADGLKRGGVS